MKAKIVVVEDEQDLLDILEHRLKKEGYDILTFGNTSGVGQTLKQTSVDLIIMDRNLPDIEGSEYIAMLRDQGVKTPVIFLSAKDTPEAIRDGFLRGADDYMTKPFDFQELFLRIEAILRRTKKSFQSQTKTYRDIVLDANAREVMIDRKPVELSKLEFDLLYVLLENPGTILDRDFLLKHVWGNEGEFQYRTVNVAINRLKERIDPDKSKDYIKTVRGIGYGIQ